MAPQPGVHVGVAAFLTDREGRLAMLQRGPDASHGANEWSIPGGWIDFGELPEQAIIRECFEEVGLSVANPYFIDLVTNTHKEQGLHVVCLCYRASIINGVLTNMEPDKCGDVRWVHVGEIEEMELFAPLRTFINKHGPGGIYL